MYPATFARTAPDRPAVIMAGSGEIVTYGELDERSNRLAHLLRSRDLGPASIIAFFMENNTAYHVVHWAARRSGLYFVPINPNLPLKRSPTSSTTAAPTALITSAKYARLAEAVAPLVPAVELRLIFGSPRRRVGTTRPLRPAHSRHADRGRDGGRPAAVLLGHNRAS